MPFRCHSSPVAVPIKAHRVSGSCLRSWHNSCLSSITVQFFLCHDLSTVVGQASKLEQLAQALCLITASFFIYVILAISYCESMAPTQHEQVTLVVCCSIVSLVEPDPYARGGSGSARLLDSVLNEAVFEPTLAHCSQSARAPWLTILACRA